MTITGEEELEALRREELPAESVEVATGGGEQWRIKVEDYPTLNLKYGPNSCSWCAFRSVSRS